MKQIATALIFLVSLGVQGQNVGIGTSSPKAALDVTSTTNGFLPPRMTLAQRGAITNPAAGLIVYCSDCGTSGGELTFFDGNTWKIVGSSNGSSVSTAPIAPSNLNVIFNSPIVCPLIPPILYASLSWTDISTNESGYKIERKSLNGVPSLIGQVGSNVTSFSDTVSILSTAYTYRVYAYNNIGNSAQYSNEVLVQPVVVLNPTLTYGSITDQDGYRYKTIQIGTQTWMAENLKARRYRNGDLIPVVTDASTWSNLTSGATRWYKNDSATYNCPYGKLYNWYAVADSRSLCPTGWHVPTDAEFTTLTNFLGGNNVAGGKMKSAGIQYWISPNEAADNSSGWSGLPGGNESSNGSNDGKYGSWWSSTESTEYYTTYAWFRGLNYVGASASRSYDPKIAGYSVRCLKD